MIAGVTGGGQCGPKRNQATLSLLWAGGQADEPGGKRQREICLPSHKAICPYFWPLLLRSFSAWSPLSTTSALPSLCPVPRACHLRVSLSLHSALCSISEPSCLSLGASVSI
jgi:hypothetical protein